MSRNDFLARLLKANVRLLVPFERCKLKVPTEPVPWPKDRAELVGVNSFGIGGSNAHVCILKSQEDIPRENVADTKFRSC